MLRSVVMIVFLSTSSVVYAQAPGNNPSQVVPPLPQNVPAAPAQKAPLSNKKFKDPYKAFDAGAYDPALQGFVDLQIEKPNDTDLMLSIGAAHYHMNNLKTRQLCSRAPRPMAPKQFNPKRITTWATPILKKVNSKNQSRPTSVLSNSIQTMRTPRSTLNMFGTKSADDTKKPKSASRNNKISSSKNSKSRIKTTSRTPTKSNKKTRTKMGRKVKTNKASKTPQRRIPTKTAYRMSKKNQPRTPPIPTTPTVMGTV